MLDDVRLIIAVFLTFALVPVAVTADAIVVSQAMFASTIAEYFVEDDYVRVELEIGAADINAFRNLMPDQVYEDMGFGSRPLAERIEGFFSRDQAIYANDAPLAGVFCKLGRKPGLCAIQSRVRHCQPVSRSLKLSLPRPWSIRLLNGRIR